MRSFLTVLFACLFVPANVAAQPGRTDSFEGVGRVAQAATQSGNLRSRSQYRARRNPHRQPRWRLPGHVAPLTLAQGFRGELALVAGLPPSLGSTTPRSFIRGRLVCAANVGAALAARGIRGTGSRLAKSYLSWGRRSGPVPGAVAVFGRRGGGHVAIVHSVRNGQVIYLNPSSRRQAWVVGPYRRQPIAFRVAG